MKFRLHAVGLFITSAVSCLTSVTLVVAIAIRVFAIEPNLAVFLIVVPVFYASYLGAEHLYAKHFRLCCPGCGAKLAMDYKPGIAVSYTCACCGYTYDTRMAIHQSDW
jgi:hypothetical protein